MDESVLFAVGDDHLHHLSGRPSLGNDVIAVLQSDLGVTVGETVLPIAHWEHDRTGPLSVALNFAGELIVVVLGDSFADEAVLLNTLSTLEQWLAPMDMADLAELSGNKGKFFEGVWELSPRTQLTLASMLRVLLINPTIELDEERVAQSLPFTHLETLRIEALEAADGTLVIARHHERSMSMHDAVGRSGAASYEHPVTLQLDSEDDLPTVMRPARTAPAHAEEDAIIDLAAEEAAVSDIDDVTDRDDVPEVRDHGLQDGEYDIDLTVEDAVQLSPSRAIADGDWPMLIRGSYYVTAQLPLHFDPTGANVEPISDELFAAGGHLALVVNLDECETSPVETASVFRWDADAGRRSLYNVHAHETTGRRRVVHLFVESAAEANRVLYLGVGEQLAQSDPTDANTVWLKISPALDRRRLTFLQSGRMPTASEPEAPSKAFSFSTVTNPQPAHRADPPEPTDSASTAGPTGNWVPNV